MERLEELDELSKPERILRFRGLLKDIVGVDDLFPPDSGVREPARSPRPVCPRVGAVAIGSIDQQLAFV